MSPAKLSRWASFAAHISQAQFHRYIIACTTWLLKRTNARDSFWSIQLFCGGHSVATTRLHARFGDTFYEHNANCDWIKLIKQSNQRMYFTFMEFDIGNEKACQFDFVDLYEERHTRDCIMYGPYCGEKIHLEIVSTGQLLLRFRTYNTVPGEGFIVSHVIADSIGASRFNRCKPIRST